MKTAWLFPGQGAQVVGMGKAVAESSAAARAVFQEADDALGESLSTLCFEGPIERLTETANTQPALLVTSIAILRAMQEAHPLFAPPSFGAGHSLGEYSALVASGALDLGEAVRAVRRRGVAMQSAVPTGVGAMAAVVGMDDADVAEICHQAAEGQVVSPANFNAKGQVVIAGDADAVRRASQLVAERGSKAIPLKVSAPFHCALMKPAADAMRPVLEALTVGQMAFPVIANVDAAPNTDPARVKTLLVSQIAEPVQWVKTVELLASEGVTKAFEFGPGKVLAGLIKRIAKQISVVSVADSDGIRAAIESI